MKARAGSITRMSASHLTPTHDLFAAAAAACGVLAALLKGRALAVLLEYVPEGAAFSISTLLRCGAPAGGGSPALAAAEAARSGDEPLLHICHRVWGVADFNIPLRCAADGGKANTLRLCRALGGTDFDMALACAARRGHVEIVWLCRAWGGGDMDLAAAYAACGGKLAVLRLCRAWGATDLDRAMRAGAATGREPAVRLCRELGATAFQEAAKSAAAGGHAALAALLSGWGAA